MSGVSNETGARHVSVTSHRRGSSSRVVTVPRARRALTSSSALSTVLGLCLLGTMDTAEHGSRTDIITAHTAYQCLGSNANAFANVAFAFKCSVVSCSAFALALSSKLLHLHLHKKHLHFNQKHFHSISEHLHLHLIKTICV